MKQPKWSLYAMAIVIVIFAASLAAPLLQGNSPVDLGLDLSGGVAVTYRPDFSSRLDVYQDADEETLLSLAKETLKSRLYRNLNTVPDVVVRGDQTIVVSIPGGENQRKILELVGQTYHLSMRLVTGEHEGPIEGEELFTYRGRHLELAEAEFSGNMLDERHIRVEHGRNDTFDVSDMAAKVSFKFQSPYDEAFETFTGENVGRQLAILLDDRVEWVGVIENAIAGSGVLAGGYTFAEASDVAMMLKSGTLPISLEVEELTSVGPSLGQELQDLGLGALLLSLGLLGVLVAVAYLHRSALLVTGLVSLGCLLISIGGLAALFGLTLDMVGIAGIVLSIGMGMDAFIIVFESLESGSKGLTRKQIQAHHGRFARRAYSFSSEGRTLFHANATTLVVILLLLGTERLKSFAVFILVGIFASVLTIFMTRAVLQSLYGRLPDAGFDLLAWLRRFRPRLFRWRKPYYAAVATGVLVLSLSVFGALPGAPALELGADFQEGTQVTVTASSPERVDEALAQLLERYPDVAMRSQQLGDAGADRHLLTLSTAIVTEIGGRSEAADEAGIQAVELAEILAAASVELQGMSSIDSRVSSHRLMASLSVFLVSFLLLAVYFVAVEAPIDRFFEARGHRQGSAAARWLIFAGVFLAVVTDVAVVLVALAWLGIPISLAVIAALLTIVGYSVNDSVVLWSHVRNLAARLSLRNEKTTSVDLVTRSVDRILSRAVLTSLSTTVPAWTILAVGLDPLRDFAWVMIVGTVAGTLSSMFIVGWFAVRALSVDAQGVQTATVRGSEGLESASA